MSNISLIEQVKKLQRALREIANPDWKDCNTYASAFEKAQRVADAAISESYRKSFYVLKQFEKPGPVYKLEICSESLEVLHKEVVNGIPEGWSSQDFYDLLDEGNRLNIS